jgi:hypothetical protein
MLTLAAAALAATDFAAPEVAYFPSGYFDTEAKATLQRRAMERWPGPTQLVAIWQSEDLGRRAQAAILLGASASHERALLPLYREAALSSDPQLRMAAAYGYRELLADALPNVAGGVDEEAGRRLANEIEAVQRTLRARSLTELWLQALLAGEDESMPGWTGVVMQRQAGTCLNALEKVVAFEDFNEVTVAYRTSQRTSTRLGLLRLLEAITLQRFFVQPADGRTGWGMKNVNEGLEALDSYLDLWLDQRCIRNPKVILTSSLSSLGVQGVDPMGPESWDVWIQLLKQGTPAWRMMASRRLYELGGRWADLSMFAADSPGQQQLQDDLIVWYRLLPSHLLDRKKPAGSR